MATRRGFPWLFLIGVFCFSHITRAEEKSILQTTEQKPLYYPASIVHRPLLLSRGLILSSGSLHVRDVLRGYGMDWNLQGTYGLLENVAVRAKLRAIVSSSPQTLQMGGIGVGGQLRLIKEDVSKPEVLLDLDVSALGLASYLGDVKRGPILFQPGVEAKKLMRDDLALISKVIAGFGKDIGLVLSEAGGMLRLTQKFDAALLVGLTNLGFDEPSFFGISPALYYHWKEVLDVSVGTNIALYGGSKIGNNFRLGITAVF